MVRQIIISENDLFSTFGFDTFYTKVRYPLYLRYYSHHHFKFRYTCKNPETVKIKFEGSQAQLLHLTASTKIVKVLVSIR
jgi:hypothetical protein